MHLLLSTAAATGLIGPGYGWTAAGERLFLNAIAWAVDVAQVREVGVAAVVADAVFRDERPEAV